MTGEERETVVRLLDDVIRAAVAAKDLLLTAQEEPRWDGDGIPLNNAAAEQTVIRATPTAKPAPAVATAPCGQPGAHGLYDHLTCDDPAHHAAAGADEEDDRGYHAAASAS